MNVFILVTLLFCLGPTMPIWVMRLAFQHYLCQWCLSVCLHVSAWLACKCENNANENMCLIDFDTSLTHTATQASIPLASIFMQLCRHIFQSLSLSPSFCFSIRTLALHSLCHCRTWSWASARVRKQSKHSFSLHLCLPSACSGTVFLSWPLRVLFCCYSQTISTVDEWVRQNWIT